MDVSAWVKDIVLDNTQLKALQAHLSPDEAQNIEDKRLTKDDSPYCPECGNHWPNCDCNLIEDTHAAFDLKRDSRWDKDL